MHYYGVNCYNNKKMKNRHLCILHSISSQYQYERQSKSFLAKYEEVELEI